MAKRPVYIVYNKNPYFKSIEIEFEWNGGFAVSQKQKNIKAIHNRFSSENPNKKILEISSKSMQEGGKELSAFNLLKFVPELNKSIPVENVFQSGKVFQKGGPFKDLMEVSPRETKRDERIKSSGKLICFMFDGKEYPLIPQTAFYDFIYINALFENKKLMNKVIEYDAFTDIEFNPDKSINCQAKAAALFVSLSRLNLLEKTKNFDEFLSLFNNHSTILGMECGNKKELERETAVHKDILINSGDIIKHKIWGNGKIVKIDNKKIEVHFDSVGKKILELKWCKDNCEIPH